MGEDSKITSINAQVRVEGSVDKVSAEESEQYFHIRPLGSQIEAIVNKLVRFSLFYLLLMNISTYILYLEIDNSFI